MNQTNRHGESSCPRCGRSNLAVARFCGHCGLSLASGDSQDRAPGRIAHPAAALVPAGFAPVRDAVDLYFRWSPAGGGPMLLGTETLIVDVLNAGYALCEVILEIRGSNRSGAVAYRREHSVELLGHGEQVSLEIPSYDLLEPVTDLAIRLTSAEFHWEP